VGWKRCVLWPRGGRDLRPGAAAHRAWIVEIDHQLAAEEGVVLCHVQIAWVGVFRGRLSEEGRQRVPEIEIQRVCGVCLQLTQRLRDLGDELDIERDLEQADGIGHRPYIYGTDRAFQQRVEP
jgi:hypothetical protein